MPCSVPPPIRSYTMTLPMLLLGVGGSCCSRCSMNDRYSFVVTSPSTLSKRILWPATLSIAEMQKQRRAAKNCAVAERFKLRKMTWNLEFLILLADDSATFRALALQHRLAPLKRSIAGRHSLRLDY